MTRASPILRTVAAPRRRRTRRAHGITLVETMVALSVTAVGTLTAASVLLTSMKLDRANREEAAAFSAVRAQVETIRAADFSRVLDLYDSNTANDPGGTGTAPGTTFWNTTLAKLGSQTTVTRQVILPLNDAGQMREDLNLPELGLPADLNGDGAVDAADHRTDYVIVPFAVRITWTGQNGARTYTLAGVVHE